MTMIRPNQTVQIPPLWDCGGDPPHALEVLLNELVGLQCYLPYDDTLSGEDNVPLVDDFSSDQFRMYEFKVRKCARGRFHDWTECPFAHPGEKARRRDPRGFRYSGTACPDFRKGACKNGDSCEFAHGVFECWLHPDRYRTQPCKDGLNCSRRVCFFAHTPEQLRAVSPRCTNSRESDFSGSPMRHAFDLYHAKAAGFFVSSPTSILLFPSISPSVDSPPLSPSRLGIGCSVDELVTSMRNVQIGKLNLSPGAASAGFCSPRGPILWPGNYAMPSYEVAAFEVWDNAASEEVPMERVESGRDLRARVYTKLSKDNSLERAAAGTAADPGLDVGWVSELVN